MDLIEAEFQKEQYSAIRQELLDSNKNGHEAVRWGHGALAVMISGGLAAQTLKGIDIGRVVYFGFVVPIFSLLAFFLWFGEVVRQQRAYSFLEDLERQLNPQINAARRTLVWHHEWLRTKTDNPLQSLQFGHYRNIAFGFWFWIPVSAALSIWACLIATDRVLPRVLWILYVTLEVIGTFVLYQVYAKRWFKYDLVAWLLAVPWLSHLIVLLRVLAFALIGLHVAHLIHIGAAAVILMCAAYIGADILDGYLVRRFSPGHAAAFGFLDRCVDVGGVTVLVLLLGLYAKLSLFIVWVVLIRESGLAIIAIAITIVRRQPFSVSGLAGRLFHLLLSLLIVLAALDAMPANRLVDVLCAAVAVLSLIAYARDPEIRSALRDSREASGFAVPSAPNEGSTP